MSKLFSKSTLLAVALFLTSTANAAIVDEYWIDQANGLGAYDLTNNTGVSIYGFAVGNNDAVNAIDNSGLGWGTYIFEANTWNQTFNTEIYGIDTAAIGDFNTLFPGFTQAVIYAASTYVINPAALLDGTTATGFEFYTMFLSSPYVTFDQNFNLIDQGKAVHVVPVPAAAWLFFSGIIGLAGVARRKT